ncbi:unnamed protein product, partial [Polarella glacialis]
ARALGRAALAVPSGCASGAAGAALAAGVEALAALLESCIGSSDININNTNMLIATTITTTTCIGGGGGGPQSPGELLFLQTDNKDDNSNNNNNTFLPEICRALTAVLSGHPGLRLTRTGDNETCLSRPLAKSLHFYLGEVWREEEQRLRAEQSGSERELPEIQKSRVPPLDFLQLLGTFQGCGAVVQVAERRPADRGLQLACARTLARLSEGERLLEAPVLGASLRPAGEGENRVIPGENEGDSSLFLQFLGPAASMALAALTAAATRFATDVELLREVCAALAAVLESLPNCASCDPTILDEGTREHVSLLECTAAIGNSISRCVEKPPPGGSARGALGGPE